VGAAQALSYEAYAFIRENAMGLDDADAIAAVAGRTVLTSNRSGRTHARIRSVESARPSSGRLRPTASSRVSTKRSPENVESLTSVATRLRIALCLLDRRARPHGPIDAVLDEYRELVRRRRGGGR
jgi:hypothetical protein